MMKRRFNFLILCGLVILVVLNGCALFNKSGEGNKAFAIGEYNRAANIYKKAYTKEKNKYLKGEMSFNMGECYRQINKPSKAVPAYTRSLRTTYKNPLTELYIGQCLLKVGKAEEARKHLLLYTEKYPADLLGQATLKSCDVQLNPPVAKRFNIEKVKEFNSKYSTYSPVFGGTENDIVLFSSLRYFGKLKGLNKITGQGPSNLYFTRKDAKGKWMEPEALDEVINTQFDEGACTVASGGQELYFTRCRFDATKMMGAEIYVAPRAGGRWGEPVALKLAGDSIICAHPAVTPDNLTLYFVSDMPGGKGGKDIWKVTRASESGEWGKPENVGYPVNTKGDEIFPTVSPEGTLYFSTNGLPGLGGLDIFRVGKDANDSIVAINMGEPINSFSDDFGMVFKPESQEGLFTSSRDNVKGVDNIFKFTYRLPTLGMKGVVFDEKTRQPLTKPYMRLVSSDGTQQKVDIQPDGSFACNLKPLTDYVFLVAAEGYFNSRTRFKTEALVEDELFNFQVAMSLKSAPIVLETVYYSNNGFKVEGDLALKLDHLAGLMADNPQVRIEINSHTDNQGDATEKIVLAQKRAQAIDDYLTAKGVESHRLVVNSYGGTKPLMADKNLAAQYKFLNAGDLLDEAFINGLKNSDKATAIRLNNRTEFKVIE
jgi:peptidoglycan-associated lipoprotein